MGPWISTIIPKNVNFSTFLNTSRPVYFRSAFFFLARRRGRLLDRSYCVVAFRMAAWGPVVPTCLSDRCRLTCGETPTERFGRKHHGNSDSLILVASEPVCWISAYFYKMPVGSVITMSGGVAVSQRSHPDIYSKVI